MQRAHLLHDAGLALRKGDVAARLVRNELDLDLASLATTLLIVIVIAASRWARTFDASGTLARSAVSGRIVELGGRGLVMLVRDVGHFVLKGITKSLKR